MRQGTTPTHTFTLPFDTATVQTARVIYAQNSAVLLVKEKGALKMAGSDISVRLTQEETLRFRSGAEVEIQLRVLTKAGDALSSDIHAVPVARCLDGEVLV